MLFWIQTMVNLSWRDRRIRIFKRFEKKVGPRKI